MSMEERESVNRGGSIRVTHQSATGHGNEKIDLLDGDFVLVNDVRSIVDAIIDLEGFLERYVVGERGFDVDMLLFDVEIRQRKGGA